MMPGTVDHCQQGKPVMGLDAGKQTVWQIRPWCVFRDFVRLSAKKQSHQKGGGISSPALYRAPLVERW